MFSSKAELLHLYDFDDINAIIIKTLRKYTMIRTETFAESNSRWSTRRNL